MRDDRELIRDQRDAWKGWLSRNMESDDAMEMIAGFSESQWADFAKILSREAATDLHRFLMDRKAEYVEAMAKRRADGTVICP